MTRCSVSGEAPINPDDAPVPNSDKRPDGQHVDHWVMCPGEIIKAGFKRPVRLKYQHVGTPGPKHPLRDLTDEERERWPDEGYVKFEEYPKGDSSSLGRFWTQAGLDKIGKGCGVATSMPMAIAETYAANPSYFPVGSIGEFVWDGTNDRVGT